MCLRCSHKCPDHYCCHSHKPQSQSVTPGARLSLDYPINSINAHRLPDASHTVQHLFSCSFCVCQCLPLHLSQCLPFLFPSSAPLPPSRLLVLARRVHQDGIVLALALCRLVLGLLVQLLHELGLDLAAALLPPGLFGVGLGEDFVELGAEFVVLGDFVGGLEDGWAPVGGEGVGLKKLVQMANLKMRVSSCEGFKTSE